MTMDPDRLSRVISRFFDDADEPFAAVDMVGTIVLCNEAFAATRGQHIEDVRSQDLLDVLSQNTTSELGHRLAEVNDHPEGQATVILADPFDDNRVTRWRFTYRHYCEFDLILLWGRDQTEEGRLNQEVRDRTILDRLTGLANRAALTYEVEQVLTARQPTALMLIGVDDFTVINDSYGLKFGDDVLTVVARRLSQVAGVRNTAARVAGDQFGIMIKRQAQVESVMAHAQRVVDELCNPITLNGAPVHLTVSMGVAIAEFSSQQSALDLLREADTALARAKELGGNRITLFKPELQTRLKDRVKTEIDLRAAVRFEQLDADIQGIYSLRDGSLAGFEALARWRHPVRGTVMPLDFLSVAEHCGLLDDVLSAVLDRTLGHLGGWLRADRSRSVSVNVAPSQLARPDLVSRISEPLERNRISPHQLTVELVEDQLVEGEWEIRMLERLHQLGVRLAIDDFGSGASSLGYFWKLPVSKLKLDRSLISPITTNHKVRTVVESVVALADRLGYDVVAEGIESQEQLDSLVDIGCSHAQGFFLHRPAPLAAADEVCRYAPGLRMTGAH